MTVEMETIQLEFNDKLSAVDNSKALSDLRVEYLGKKGKVTGLMKEMKNLSNEERPAYGQKVNVLRNEIETAIAELETELSAAAMKEKLQAETIDVTLPGRTMEDRKSVV